MQARTALDRIRTELKRDREVISASRIEIARIQQRLYSTIQVMDRACRQIEELSSKAHPIAETIRSISKR
jgi:hypothetical protein